MATSTVRGSTEIYAMSQGDTLSVALQTNGLPLVQYLSGAGGLPTPNWTVPDNQPIIYPHILSTLVTGQVTAIANPKWFYDGVRIVAGDARFEITTYTVASVAIPALKITDNLMVSATSNKTIRGEFDVTTGGITTTVQASKDVERKVASESAYIGMISATNAGALDATNTSIVARARLFTGGNEDSSYTVQWWKLVANDVDGIPDGQTDTGKTGKDATFTRADVDLQEIFIAKFFKGGNQVATAYITLFDYTDPYEMIFTTTPFRVPVGGSSTTSVKVVNRGSITALPEFTQFAFSLTDGVTEIRSKPLGTNTFTTNYSDFAGREKLILLVTTTSNT